MPLLRLKPFLLPPFYALTPSGPAPRLFLSFAFSSRSSPSPSSSTGDVLIKYEPWSGLQSWRESPINEDRFWGPHGPQPLSRSKEPLSLGPGEAAIASASSLTEMGAVVLLTSDPELKSQLSHLAFSRWRLEGLPVGVWEPPDKPARPPKPRLVSPKEIPAPRDSGLPLNAYMLHNLAHVELNAIDLAWDTVVRFSPFLKVLGEGFFADFARVADDESRHFGWCSQRLTELGFRYGDMPAHNMLWKECEKSSHDVAARLAVIPMVQEARRLHAGHGPVHELGSIGDLRTSALLVRIIDEDSVHVTVGFHWLSHVQRSHRPSLKYFQSAICLNQISLEHVDRLLHLLKKCGRIVSLPSTKLLHALTIIVGPYSPQPNFLYNNIISFYVDLGELETSRMVFGNMPERNVVSYNIIICAYSRSGDLNEAFHIFHAMRGHGFSPTQYTLSALLSSEELDISCGIQLQGLIWKNGSLSSGPFVGTSLLNLYGRYGFLDEVNAIFEEMPSRSLITWNSVITWFGKLGFLSDGVKLYKSLVRSCPNMSEGTFIGVLSGCLCKQDLELGEQFHGLVVKSGWNSTPVLNALINMYDKCGNVFLTERMFGDLDIPDIVSWNLMIGAWAKSKTPENAMSILYKMSLNGLEPDQTTFSSSVNASIGFENPRYGEYVHGKLIKTSYEKDVFAGSSLVDFYAKFDRLEDAHCCFDDIRAKNVVSWNALISGYSSKGSCTSVKLLREMLELGFKANESSLSAALKASTGFETRQLHCASIKMGYENKEYVLSSLIISYARNGLTSDALAFVTAFDDILSVVPANVIAGIYNQNGQFDATTNLLSRLEEADPVSWNIVIEALTRSGDYAEVVQVFKYMTRCGMQSDKFTFVSLLTVCSKISDFGFGASIHGLMIKTDFSRCDALVCNILVDMYGKCGCVRNATEIFERMIEKNVISWTVLINSLGVNGYANEALKRYREMESLGFKPDGVCISAVLTACRHGGLVEEGVELFHQIQASSDVELEIDHYNCVVSLLARSGRLKEAEETIRRMPFPPNSLTWRSFLEGCKMNSKSRPPVMEMTSPMEARGLDAGPRLVQKLVGFGDNKTSKIVAKIADEETAHVSVGVDWFIAVCRRMNLPPSSTFKELLSEYNVELKGPFNHSAREKAGIPRDWYDPSSSTDKQQEQQQLSVVYDRLAHIIAEENENSSLNMRCPLENKSKII